VTAIALGPAKAADGDGAIPSVAAAECGAIGVAVSWEGAVEATVSVRPVVPAMGEYLTSGVASGASGDGITKVSSVAEEAETATAGCDVPSLSDAGCVPPTTHSPAPVGPETASLNVSVTMSGEDVAADATVGAIPSAAVTVDAAMFPSELDSVGVAGGANATAGRASAASAPVTK